jgi:MFS family permease
VVRRDRGGGRRGDRGSAHDGDLITAGSSRRDVLDISLIICATDLVYGMVAPTFSLYVESLGGSAVLVGVLAGIVGVTRLLGAVPVGRLSDRWGPKWIVVCGLCLFFGSCALFTFPSDPFLLLIPRVLFALAILSTFPLGIAYIGDFVRRERRTLAISIYVSAQGLGYAVGPIAGSWLADSFGYVTTYWIAATLALATAGLATIRLRRRPRLPRPTAAASVSRTVLTPSLLAASLANALMMLMFNGTVVPFLSLYTVGLGVSTFGIGAIYAARAAASMLARLPAGLLADTVSNAQLIVAAIVADAFAALAIAYASSGVAIGIAAVIDGIAFGAFLASSQSLVADESTPSSRGAAMGIYGMAGAAGETIGAFGFGLVAYVFQPRAVFVIAGVLLAGGAPVIVYLLRVAGRPAVLVD